MSSDPLFSRAFFKSGGIKLIRLKFSQLQPHLRHTCLRLCLSHPDPMWGVPETLLSLECCECPGAHTLKCRGRDPAGWLPQALRGSQGGTSLKELVRVQGWVSGSPRLADSETTQMVEGAKSSETDLHLHKPVYHSINLQPEIDSDRLACSCQPG